MSKYTVGTTSVDLDQRHFVGFGGEGKVFVRDKTAFKIYDDPKCMLPLAKIKELSVLDHPRIIKPETVIFDSKKQSVGYTMKAVKGETVCVLFTKAYRQRNGISDSQILHLVKDLQSLVEATHKKGIVIVDLNEMNYLVNNAYSELYAIDVNSYQTKNFPATVILPHVRDRHAKTFTEGSDWFSFGLMAFQLMIGQHPYKGGHPDFESMPANQRLDARMMKNVSAFHAGATLPKVCQPLDVIPTALKQWLKAVFEDGKRLPPPKDYDQIIAVTTVKKIAGSNLFIVTPIHAYSDTIISKYYQDGNRIVHLKNKIVLNNRDYPVPNASNIKFIFTPRQRALAVYVENQKLKVFDIQNQTQLSIQLDANAVFESNGQMYVCSSNSILELQFIEAGNQTAVSAHRVGGLLDVPGATTVYDGVVIQNLLGRWHASIFPVSRKGFCIPFPELDSYTVVNAKYESGVLIVLGSNRKTGLYDRFVFRFDSKFDTYDISKFDTYDIRKVENVSMVGINFTVNSAKICVLINEEEQVEVFSNQKDSTTLKVIDDSFIQGDMELNHDGPTIVFHRGKEIFSMAMK